MQRRGQYLPLIKIYDAQLDVPAEITQLFQVVQPVVSVVPETIHGSIAVTQAGETRP